VDLFDPGSGSQLHDFNGGILASGLFWTLAVEDRALQISRDGRRAVLDVREIDVIDSFSFNSGLGTPADVTLRVEWRASGPPVARGRGKAVAPTDPAAFLGTLATARSVGSFAGDEWGFAFASDPGASADRGFAEMGRERNGVFL
jgi:hypothetical protein